MNNSPAPAREESTDNFVDSLSRDETAIENCSMALHIDRQTVLRMLKQFGIECKAKKAEHINMRDFSAHFVDWARIQIEKKTGSSGRNKRTNTDSDVNAEWN